MKPSGRRAKTKRAQMRYETYVLQLIVAGDEPNSRQARKNLTRRREAHLKGRYELIIVDILEDFKDRPGKQRVADAATAHVRSLAAGHDSRQPERHPEGPLCAATDRR